MLPNHVGTHRDGGLGQLDGSGLATASTNVLDDERRAIWCEAIVRHFHRRPLLGSGRVELWVHMGVNEE